MIAEGREGFTLGRPGKVVAGEKNFIAVEQHLVTAGMAGRGNQKQIGVERDEVFASGDALNAEPRGAIVMMHDARAMEMRGEARVVGDIVAVRKEHERDAAQLLDAPDERGGEAGRVHENIAAGLWRTNDEVGPAAKTRFGSEPAEIDVVHNGIGKGIHGGAGVTVPGSADGSRGAGHQRHQGALHIRGTGRLAVDAGLTAMVMEGLRGNLAAGVAINAGCIDKEIAGDVLRQSLLDLGHYLLDIVYRESSPCRGLSLDIAYRESSPYLITAEARLTGDFGSGVGLSL